MVSWESYFDESISSGNKSQILCVAGYLIHSDHAKSMDDDWRKVLSEYGLPYFHMVDCAHGNGFFEGMKKEKRIQIQTKFIDLIKRYTTRGFAAIVNPSRYPNGNNGDILPHDYTFCVDICLLHMLTAPEVTRSNGKVAAFFESGHKHGSKAQRYINETPYEGHIAGRFSSVTFAKKEDIRLLQAADLLAWQCTKHVKGKVFDNRPPRKDFVSLMSHPHSIAYVVFQENVGNGKLDVNPIMPNARRDEYICAMFSKGEEHEETLRKLRGSKIKSQT